MTRMPVATWTGHREVQVEEHPLPDVPDGWALVKVAYTGICGTDLAILDGKHPRAQVPLVMGHEIAGWVERAGAHGPTAGTLVAVEPLMTCGRCRACRDGNSHVCSQLGLYGIDAPGGLAAYIALPPETLHAVPSHVDPRLAALVEPLAVAVHAVGLSGLSDGDLVAVYGAGPIGIFTALVARRAGARDVVVAEPNDWRRQVAADLGFSVVPANGTMAQTLGPLSDGEGADVTFDSAAHPSVAADLAAATRVLGTIVIVGVYKQPTPVALQAVCFKELRIVGVRVYTSEDMVRAIDLAASGVLGLDRLPTTAFRLDDVAAAFEAAAGGENCLKVLVTPLDEHTDVRIDGPGPA